MSSELSSEREVIYASKKFWLSENRPYVRLSLILADLKLAYKACLTHVMINYQQLAVFILRKHYPSGRTWANIL